MSIKLLQFVILAYTFSVAFFFIGVFYKAKYPDKFALVFLKAGFILHTLIVALRWYEAKRPPFANMHEALILFAWSIILIFMIFDRMYKIKFLAKPVSILVLIITCFAALNDNIIGPVLPALQSRWITIHVVSYFIGYAAMSLSVICGLYYLANRRAYNTDSEKLQALDSLGYYSIIFAFPFLTIGMTTGSVWANVAWGTYWSWDPKETCSLITWLVYGLYLHLRILRGWKGDKAAWLSVIGYFAVLFTFVGVNFILPGLHSYS